MINAKNEWEPKKMHPLGEEHIPTTQSKDSDSRATKQP